MGKFCPKCGKRIKTGVFCNNCNPVQLIKNVKDIKVWVCGDCNRFFFRNKWRPYTEDTEPYKETAKEQITVEPGTKIDIKLHYKGQKVKEIEFFATDKQNNEEEYKTPISVDKTMCPSCSKKSANSIAGTLQIRNLTEDVYKDLDEELARSEKAHVHILTLDEKPGYIDIDMTNQTWIERIARNLQEKYGGQLKVDYRLQTRDHQTSKDVYRITATLMLPTVKKREALLYDDEPYVVNAIGKNLSVMNLKTGEHIKLDFTDKFRKLETHKTTLSQLKPHIEALDPETYQSEPIKEIEKIRKPKLGMEIKVLSFNGALYHF